MVRWQGTKAERERRGSSRLRGVGPRAAGSGCSCSRHRAHLRRRPAQSLEVAHRPSRTAQRAGPRRPGEDPAADFAAAILGTTEERGTRCSPSGRDLRAARRSCSSPTGPVGLRHGVARRALLLPARPKAVPRPRLLQRAARAGRPRRLRRGIRGRPRSRPPRPEPDRHGRQVRRLQQRAGEARGERALGAARAAGRLLRGRLGHSRPPDADVLEPGDIEEGLERRRRDRRRPAAAKRAARSAGVVHARHLGAAPEWLAAGSNPASRSPATRSERARARRALRR